MFTSVTVRCAVFVLQIYNRWCAGLRQRISVFYIFHEKGQKRKDTASHPLSVVMVLRLLR